MSDKYHIPQHLDEPFKLILWTTDELIALSFPFLFFTFVLNMTIMGFITGIILLFALKKIKGEQGHFFIYNIMYWYFPAIIHFRKTPRSYLREWLG